MILLALAIQAAAPAPDTAALAQRVAESSTLAQLLPLIAGKEVGDLAKEHPTLTAAEQETLRATGSEVMAAARTRLIAALAPSYAAALTPDQMRAIIAWEDSAAARARRAADVPALVGAAKVLDGYDYKGEVMKAFCAKTGKGCTRAR
ncbi:hypothetical protein SAMN06297144_0130 [Sphingomonas guangdongensis]|uniref:DUF2059 domain-containing protein n=1 Tax=Sphingomonas guangdongensis TaxID=1141890 RepID=A0A285Q9W2_9SPHN|nr:hypothetical protein [Sphingomonas guangdongensis]SOB78626.1 hypothetical protein SAMN06297144_0130 [Sphingomonas guangdongensis]